MLLQCWQCLKSYAQSRALACNLLILSLQMLYSLSISGCQWEDFSRNIVIFLD
jgi:hypothetical protein